MADQLLAFLKRTHPIYDAHVEGWKRDERRLYGGDAVLVELARWKAEEEEYYTKVRLPGATYLTIPSDHMSLLSGHLRRASPMPNFGAMGEVRTRDKLTVPSPAEIFWYNCDGIGQDGQELPSFIDGVQRRAGATGFRWMMSEMPSRQTLREIRLAAGRDPESQAITLQDQIDGFHTYAVEDSPIVWTNWKTRHKTLLWAIRRITIEAATDIDDAGNPIANKDGYYLVVRRGYSGLGTRFAEGGWWKFDSDGVQIPDGHGTWDDTRGQIPLFRFFAEQDQGTTERAAIARSLTMELGQIAVDLMNAESEYRHNIRQACKAVTYILGGDEKTHAVTIGQHETGSLIVTIPAVMGSDGRMVVPTLANSASYAVSSETYNNLVERKLALAREIMVKQLTSTPDSSGRSKEAGFTEATAPLLARLAAARQTAENTLLYFTALRFGKEPNAFIVEPKEHDLRDIVADVDSMIDTLKRSALSSPTLEVKAVLAKAERLGFLDSDEDTAKIKAELAASSQQKQDRQAQSDSLLRDLNLPAA